MANTPASGSEPTDTFDRIAHDLQELRLSAGAPSYADIVQRFSEDRRDRGVDPARARPARSTVYDAFRPGRARINARLVGEIATALGASDPDAWVRRCQRARRAVDHPKAVSRARRAEPSDPTSPAASRPSTPASADEPADSQHAAAPATGPGGGEPGADPALGSPDPSAPGDVESPSLRSPSPRHADAGASWACRSL